jgi:hypothetical protein
MMMIRKVLTINHKRYNTVLASQQMNTVKELVQVLSVVGPVPLTP